MIYRHHNPDISAGINTVNVTIIHEMYSYIITCILVYIYIYKDPYMVIINSTHIGPKYMIQRYACLLNITTVS